VVMKAMAPMDDVLGLELFVGVAGAAKYWYRTPIVILKLRLTNLTV